MNSLETPTLITTLIYPCHSTGGTVRTLFLSKFKPAQEIICPLLTPAYAMGSPCGLLTRQALHAVASLSLCSTPYRVRLVRGQDAIFPDARDFDLPVFPFIPVAFQMQPFPRRSGPPGVSSGYFQRTIVRYTGGNLVTDRGLCPVLRTRPGSAPPQICLPSTLPGTGHTCTSTHAFA